MNSNPTFIALDIETTGFDPAKDQIIEVAAVKFTREKTLDTWSSLFSSSREIPPIVEHITGISQSMLENAPSMEEKREELINFIGSSPIVGHNISFDLTFLNQKGVFLKNDGYDTLQLAGMLLPGYPSYSLDTLTRLLKIEHTEKHRALSDTIASQRLFLMLLEKIDALQPETLHQINTVLEKSNWPLGALFKNPARPATAAGDGLQKSASKKNAETAPTTAKEKIPTAAKNSHKEAAPTLPQQLQNFFEKDGALAQTIPDFEPRASQKELAEEIFNSLSSDCHLLAEAGTGTGKTLAYLVSALQFAWEKNTRVIVSTYTKNLQEQLINKDIPLLKKALLTGTDFFGTEEKTDTTASAKPTGSAPASRSLATPLDHLFATLKGKRNYLSLARFRQFLQKPVFEEHETTFAIKILLWLQITQTGDLEEISAQGKEYSLLDDVCHDETENESGSSYESQQQMSMDQEPSDAGAGANTETGTEESFLKRARTRAENAKIVVVNHALLLQDAKSSAGSAEGGIIPPYDFIIFDEAHHLERVTTDTLTLNLSLTAFSKPYEKLLSLANRYGIFSDTKAAGLQQEVQSAHAQVEILFGLLGIFMQKIAQEEKSQYQTIIKPHMLETPEWEKLKACAVQLYERNEKIVTGLETVSAGARNAVRGIIRSAVWRLREIMDMLSTLFKSDDIRSRINWLYSTQEGHVCMKSAPAQAGPTLRQLFFDTKKSVILISATLQVEKSFAFIKDQVGLTQYTGELSEKYFPSHFDYPDQVKIILPEDMPRPMTEGNFAASCQVIEDTIRANGGRTLVLFTSKRALTATYLQIAPRMKESGFTILAQGVSGGRGKILEHFKEEPQTSALFGTASFWEGIDIPGNMLTCVIMQKLPFDPPDDPIIFFRGQRYVNSWNEFQLPRAILRFKQGFGRLIRTAQDRGTIIILDSRIIQNSYGQNFLSSLPEEITLQYCQHADIAKYIPPPVE